MRLLLLALLLAPVGAETLWTLGTADGDTAEFAHAPDGYAAIRDDAFFVVGRSDPRHDWPYALPGPADNWAGSRPHAFRLVFGARLAGGDGEGRLVLDLADVQAQVPPRLRVGLNGHLQELDLPAGAGDHTIFGEPRRGRRHRVELALPAAWFHAGANTLTLESLSGSWLLFDALSLDGPPGAVAADAVGTVVADVSSPPVLVRRDGALRQLVVAEVHQLGEAAEATYSTCGKAGRLRLEPGRNRIEVPVPPFERPTPATFALRCGERVERPVTLKPVRRWVVWVLSHSHVDIGYTHHQAEVEANQHRFLDEAMALAQKSRAYPEAARFRWNAEVLWGVDSYLRQASPEQRQSFADAVRRGDIGLDALYANLLTGLCSPEEMLRAFRLATELRHRLGVPLDSAMISDVPGYTWGIVSAMHQAGVRYFSVGPNGGDRIGGILAHWADKPFWWIGPSGREKVLVWIPRRGYWGRAPVGEALLGQLAEMEAGGYPYDMVQIRHCLGDNAGPDPTLSDQIREWNAAYAYPQVRLATTHEMFAAFEAKWGARLPRYAGDLTPYWEDGAASSAAETAMTRRAADSLSQAETLFALRRPLDYPAVAFSGAWREVMLFNEHTWGAHNSISQPDSEFVRQQWDYKRAFALRAAVAARELQAAALAPAGPPGAGVTVWNPTDRPRRELVISPNARLGTAGGLAGPDGRPVALQPIGDGAVAFVADVPPLAATTYQPTAAAGEPAQPARASTTELTNGLTTVRLDPATGDIASLRMPGIDGEIVAAGEGLNAYRYVLGRDPAAAQPSGPPEIRVTADGPVVASVSIRSSAPGSRSLERMVMLVADVPEVYLLNTVDKLPVREKEAVRFVFPFGLRSPRWTVEAAFSATRPERDQLPGACRAWFSLRGSARLDSAQGSVELVSLDAPMIELGTPGVDGAWPETRDPGGRLASYAMNNYWHTNYRAEQEGPVLFEYHLRPASDAPAGSALVVGPADLTADHRPLLTLDGPARLASLKPADTWPALVVRLVGGPTAGPTTLRWREPTAVFRTDLGELPGAPLGGPIHLQPGQLVTLCAVPEDRL